MSRFCESVEHGVGDGGVFCQDIIPVFYRQLAGDDCGLAGVPVLDQFHEVHQLLAVHDLHSEVLDNKQIHLGHPVEELCGLGLNA